MPSPQQITTVITPAASNWLVSLDAALDELGLTSDGGTQDSQLGRQIGQVSAAVASYCNRVFVRQSYRDRYRTPCSWLGWGKPLVLSHAPLAVDVDGDLALTATEDGTSVDVAGWEADRVPGLLYRLDSGGSPTSWTGSLIVVDYDAGFDLIPDDVQAAALRWLTIRKNSQGQSGLVRTDEVPGVQRYDYFSASGSASSESAVPPDITEMLAPYRVWSI